MDGFGADRASRMCRRLPLSFVFVCVCFPTPYLFKQVLSIFLSSFFSSVTLFYFFDFGCAGSLWLRGLFSSYREQQLFANCSVWASDSIVYYVIVKPQPHFQFSSITQSCLTPCPMDCSTPGFSVHHQLPEFTQTPETMLC